MSTSSALHIGLCFLCFCLFFIWLPSALSLFFFPCFKEDEIVVHVISNIWLRFFASHTHTHAHRHTQTHAHTHSILFSVSGRTICGSERGNTGAVEEVQKIASWSLVAVTDTFNNTYCTFMAIRDASFSLHYPTAAQSTSHHIHVHNERKSLKKYIFIFREIYNYPQSWFWPLYIYC